MAEDAAAGLIRLYVNDAQGDEVRIKVKKSTPLWRLMDACCSRFGFQASQVHFMFNGKRIARDDTAEKLGLGDGDHIDVGYTTPRDLKYGATPLHFAVWNGGAELTRHLISSRADPNATDKDGQTPWAWAEVKDDETMMEILSAAGAGPSPVLSVNIEPSPGEILLSCTSLAGDTVYHRGFSEDALIAEVLEAIAKETGKAATLVLPSHRVLGLSDHHLTLAQVLDTPTELEKRQAEDGCSYTRQHFIKFFGKATGESMWSKAVPDEEKAALAASLVEAVEVENQNISEALIRSRIEPAKVHLCRYGGGDTEQFRHHLLHGPEFQQCRDALDAEGYSCVLPELALVLVEPSLFQCARDALVGVELHPFHTIISEDLKHLVEDVLQRIPSQKRPRLKAKGSQALDIAGNGETVPQNAEGEASARMAHETADFVTERTFLCKASHRLPATTVAQSTTEGVNEDSDMHYMYARGVNPRRCVTDLAMEPM